MTLSVAENTAFPTNANDLIDVHEAMLRQPNLPAAQSAEMWRKLAHLLMQQNAHERAVEALLEAATLDPEDAETFFNLGNLLFLTGNNAAAVTAFRQAAGLAPQNAAVWHNFGNALAACDATDGAIACLEEAVRLEPCNPSFLRSKAVHLLQAGRKGEAREAFAAFADRDPSSGIAHFNLASLKRYEAGDPQIAAMEKRFADPALGTEDRATFGFALFKAFDDLKEHERAFACLEEANRLKRSLFDYDAATEDRAFADMKAFFTPQFFEGRSGFGFEGVAPIFIVGMPRSGTTLTEQILSSHSQIAAGGEAAAMTDIVTAFLASKEKAGLVLNDDALSQQRAFDLGRNYASRMRTVALAGARFTDKMPLNFRWIGIIAAILPKAQFVHCTRDSLETCFSIYSSYFSSSGNRYAYDQAELGAFHRQYQALMAHWNTVLPGRIFEAPLDGFVADQAAQTRALLDFCGLDFEPACLEFHRNANRVTTLSAMQVRQPIYRGQDERVKPYLPFLGKLQAALSGAE